MIELHQTFMETLHVDCYWTFTTRDLLLFQIEVYGLVKSGTRVSNVLGNFIFIDREAREIMYLVVSVGLAVNRLLIYKDKGK